MILCGNVLLPFSPVTKSSIGGGGGSDGRITRRSHDLQTAKPNCDTKPSKLSTSFISLALVVTLASPLPSHAIPSLNPNDYKNQPSSRLFPLTTPFSQSKNLPTGLENGYNVEISIFLVQIVLCFLINTFRWCKFCRKIRPCPGSNPGCVSTNPKSANFAFPWEIPDNSRGNAIQKLEEAILKTQKNAKIQVVQDIEDGKYLQAEVDGGFGRDVLEFFVKGDVVSYRSMATKVTYVYPFTTALGDSKGQEERVQRILDDLGWFAPRFDAMD